MNKTLEMSAPALRTALAGLNKVLNPKSPLPILGGVRFTPEPDGQVSLLVTDLDSFAVCRLPVTGDADFPPCIVPYAKLNLMAKGARETFALVRDDAGDMKIRYLVGGHPIEQPIPTFGLEEFPPLPAFDASAAPVPEEFKETLRHALDCSGEDPTRCVLHGAFLDTQEKGHYVVATNGRHLFAANTFQFQLPAPVIVPERRFLHWTGLAEDGPWQLAVQLGKEKAPEWVRLQSEHWTFTTKAVAGPYPNWRCVVPAAEGTTLVRLGAEAVALLLQAVPQLPVNNDYNQPVTLDLRGDRLVLRAQPKDGAAVAIMVPDVRIIGPGVVIMLNRTYLCKALRFGLTELGVFDELSPMVFSAPGRKMIVMPLNPREPGAVTPAPTPANQSPPPPEAAAAAPPSATQSQSTTVESKPMVTQANTTTPTAPASERGSLKPKPEDAANGTALKAAIKQIEALRGRLRDLAAELTQAVDLIKAAEREKKASEKEVESVRATLRSLQRVQI